MNKKGQVWIETVIYILIGIALISLVLAFITPKINEKKEKIVIEQIIVSLAALDEKIREVADRGPDNRRIVDFGMRVGELYFNSQTDEIVFVLEKLTKPYSEPNVAIPVGRVIVKTTQGAKTSSVNLSIEYDLDLTFEEQQISKKFSSSSVPYRFSIENKGTNIDIKEISLG